MENISTPPTISSISTSNFSTSSMGENNYPLIKAGTKIGYFNNTVAILTSDCSFRPAKNSILVGGNGKGKTTLLKTLCGIIPTIDGVFCNFKTVYLPEELSFPEELNSMEIVNCFFPSISSTMLGIISDFRIDIKTPFQKLSKGSRQKLKILISEAFAFCNNANILCLDEPLSGLDLLSRKEFIDVWSNPSKISFFSQKVHRILSVHSGPCPVAEQSLIIEAGEINIAPPIENCDSWPITIFKA